MKVHLYAGELYPAYTVLPDDDVADYTLEVDEETAARWTAATAAFAAMQREVRDIIDPPCPECGHPKSRHQEFSAGWDYWGCLAKVGTGDASRPVRTCRCQHGIPAGRKREEEA